MTEEEKVKEAEEIVCKGCKWQICCSNQCSILLNAIKAIDVGLTEGRKDDKQLKYIDYLVKENKDLQHRLDVAQGFLDRDVEYIEMCKAVKENADLEKTVEELQLNLRSRNDLVEELTMQIHKMKCCGNCKNKKSKPTCFFCVKLKKWEMEE